MTDYLLDSNVLILALRGQSNALDFLDTLNLEKDQAFISVATRMEILAGMRPYEEQRTMDLLSTFTSLPVDQTIADRAGRLIYQYARQGVQLSFPDAQIAATALQHHLTLVTTNTQHFPMPELMLYPLNS